MSTATSSAGQWRGALHVALYLLLCAVPLGAALVGHLPPGRGVLTEFGAMLGFIGFGMMSAQFLLTARFAGLSRTVGQDLLLHFHRAAGILAAVFVLAHAAILLIAEPAFRSFLDPRVNLPRSGALSAVTVVLLVLIMTSLLRQRLAIQYEWWRLAHGLMAVFVMLVGAAHIFMVGHYAQPMVKAAAFILFALAPILLLTFIRIIRPLRRRAGQEWLVQRVVPERPKVWTLVLRPARAEAEAFSFEAGQFAWLGFGEHPLTLQQHPFTIASSARRPNELWFTIKELGDFTNRIQSIQVGSTVFIEGPAGAMVLPHDVPRLVMIAGGIGITPMMAMLRTMADDGDRRPTCLIYGNAVLEKAIFRDELERLKNTLDLTVIHIPQVPPAGWEGPFGFISDEVVAAALPASERSRTCVLICGPAKMMDVVERIALELGMSRSRIVSERFDVV